MSFFDFFKAAYELLKRGLGVINLYKRVKRLEGKPSGSQEAKFCPDCDARMQVIDAKRFDVWFYRCAKCAKTFRYPAPTAK